MHMVMEMQLCGHSPISIRNRIVKEQPVTPPPLNTLLWSTAETMEAWLILKHSSHAWFETGRVIVECGPV
jgi:hypothetical protein